MNPSAREKAGGKFKTVGGRTAGAPREQSDNKQRSKEKKGCSCTIEGVEIALSIAHCSSQRSWDLLPSEGNDEAKRIAAVKRGQRGGASQ